MNEKYNITLVMGDPYDDGHGKTDIVNIVSNLSAKEIKKAYTKGSKKNRFDYISDYCNEFVDSSLPANIVDTLVKVGFDKSIFDKCSLYKGIHSIWYDIHYQIYLFIVYLFIVYLGDNSFIYEKTDQSRIDIGGYGFGS